MAWKHHIRLGNFRMYFTYGLALRNQCKIKNKAHGGKNAAKHKVKQGGVCEVCGMYFEPSELEIHHIIPYRFKELRDDERNMMCLCGRCHDELHRNPFMQVKKIAEFGDKYGINIEKYFETFGIEYGNKSQK